MVTTAYKYLRNPILSLCGPNDELNNLRMYWEEIESENNEIFHF